MYHTSKSVYLIGNGVEMYCNTQFINIESIQISGYRVIYYCESRGFHSGVIM
jgi:hypothetical protein